jgi:hypothetical protein
MFEKKREKAAVMAYILGPFIALGSAVAGGSYLLGRATQPAVPDESITVRISPQDSTAIRNGGFTDDQLGQAFREAMKNRNANIPPRLDMPKSGPSGSAPGAP